MIQRQQQRQHLGRGRALCERRFVYDFERAGALEEEDTTTISDAEVSLNFVTFENNILIQFLIYFSILCV